jgi:hypothetical protein
MKDSIWKAFLVTLIILFTSSCNKQAFFSGTSPTPTKSIPTPAISPQTGGLIGKFTYGNNNKPLADESIFLAELLPLNDSQLKGAHVPALDPLKSPKANTDQNGNVSIGNIPPGEYALTLFTPMGPILLGDAETKKEITATIKAGQVVDVGTHKIVVNEQLIEP